MHTRILCLAQDLGWQGTHLIILDGVRREADVLHILPDVTHHLWESRREVLSNAGCRKGQPAPAPAHQPCHLGGEVCRHGSGLPLQVLVQGLCAAEQGPWERALKPRSPLRPRQATQCLASSLAEELHVVEDHAELGRCDGHAWAGSGVVATLSLCPPLLHPPAHGLAHCLSSCPRLSVHLLSQQLCVEEGSFTQVLGWKTGAQELWAMSFLHPDSNLLLVGSPHLAELGA